MATTWLPIRLMLFLASNATVPPTTLPFNISMLSAVIMAALRPAIVPLFSKLPLMFKFTTSAEISAPLPSMSPGCTRTYTCGTNTVWVEPSASVTVWLTNHTMSLVKRANCSWVNATPGVKFKSAATVKPLLIKALYWSS